MSQLYLKFRDPDGSDQRICVNRDIFVIGRHSENDLTIPDGRLSRQHARISRYGDSFSITDLGSSNGTSLNGSPIGNAETLRDGDSLELGGFPVSVEIERKEAKSPPTTMAASASVSKSPSAASAQPALSLAKSSDMTIFVITGIAAFSILVLGVIGFFAFSGLNSPPGNEKVYSTPDDPEDDPPTNRKSGSRTPGPRESPSTGDNTKPGSGGTEPPGNSSSPQPTTAGGASKTEINARKFLVSVSHEPRALLTREQADKVNAKIQSINLSAVAANISTAKKNASRITAIAAAKKISPSLLAAAAIAKLGSGSGDVVQMAESMSDPLSKLQAIFGVELADDLLLSIAFYNRAAGGTAGNLENLLQREASKTQGNVRNIRTIWYLRSNDVITQAEYDFALNFLAVGSIMQNPADYNVKSEALTF